MTHSPESESVRDDPGGHDHDPHKFERDKVCYEQNYEQFRSLNQSMWQVPIIAMTLNGGLWFAAATLRELDIFKGPLFLLSCVFNVSLIVVLIRVRYVMGSYLEKLKEFHPAGYVRAPGNKWYNRSYTVVSAFSTALALSAACSLWACVHFFAAH